MVNESAGFNHTGWVGESAGKRAFLPPELGFMMMTFRE